MAWKPYVPSSEQIKRECDKIREGWSKSEHQKRAGLVSKPLTVTEVATAEIPGLLNVMHQVERGCLVVE